MLESILIAFWLVFLAELGDKTQIATILLSAKSEHLWPIFIGSSAALLLNSLIGTMAGKLIARPAMEDYIHIASGTAFIIIGILLLLRKI
jgi:putative Ca2+/H+ antiporter (TMEM165/GDT1 family)